MNIGVIGGGLAGLTAAYELSKKGHRVVVFEKEAELGGQAATFSLEGTRVERFYHHIFTSDVDIINLIAEVGLGERLVWLDSRTGFFNRDRIWHFVTPIDLMRFRPVGLFDRLRLGLMSLYLKWYKDWPKMEGTTAREWLLRYGGKRNFDVVWSPLLKNKFGTASDEIGMVWFWGKIHLRFSSRSGNRERLGYLEGSFGTLVDALRERIISAGGEIHTSLPVERIVVEDGRAVGLSTGERTHRFDRIVATVPSHVFLSMVPQLPADYAEKLVRVRYQAAVCLVLVLTRPLSEIYWLNMSDPEIPFVAIIEHTNFVSPPVYGGKRIVYISNYLSPDNPLTRLDAADLLACYVPHLQKLNRDFGTQWVEQCQVFREVAGQPVVTTNYSSQVPEHQTPVSGLYLANTTQIYPEDRGMNYSVRLGRKVAALVGDGG